MSKSWLISGIVREKPRVGILGEYRGEDVYHPTQPKHGQINEMLMNFSGKPVLVLCFDPCGCESPEEVAQEIKESVLWAFEKRKTLTEIGDQKSSKPEPYKTGRIGIAGLTIKKEYCCGAPTCDSNFSPPFTTPLEELKYGNRGKNCKECTNGSRVDKT